MLPRPISVQPEDAVLSTSKGKRSSVSRSSLQLVSVAHQRLPLPEQWLPLPYQQPLPGAGNQAWHSGQLSIIKPQRMLHGSGSSCYRGREAQVLKEESDRLLCSPKGKAIAESWLGEGFLVHL